MAKAHELLALAEQIGRVGVFDWQVPGRHRAPVADRSGDVRACRISTAATTPGSQRVYREDAIRLRDTIATAFAAKARGIRTRVPHHAAERQRAALDRGAAPDLLRRGRKAAPRRRRQRRRHRAQARAASSCAISPRRWKPRSRNARGELEAENEARKKAEESLRQAQKMEAVGQLTGGVAHDFNNLLTIVLGGLDMIGRQLSRTCRPRRRRRASRAAKDMALQGAQRAATLTSRLLAFSRQQALEPQVDRRQQARRRHLRFPAPHARRGGVARNRAGRRPVAHLRRPQPARKRAAQSRAQRPRRHAGRRQGHDRDRQLLPRRGLCRAAAGAGRSRPVRHDRGRRHRRRHGPGDARARLRAVLHHQGRRQGHRPRA